MAKFAYNNAKNISTDQMPFELSCGYHSRILYKEEIEFHSKSKSADKFSAELRDLIIICQKILYYS